MDFSALARAIEESIREDVEGREVGIAFSGGVDSTTLAHVAKGYAERVDLLTVYGEGREAKDREWAFALSHVLGLPLHLYPLSEEEAKELKEGVERLVPFVKGNFVKVDVLVPVLKVIREAKRLSVEVLLFGSGTEELFMGYDRHYRWVEEGKSWEEIDYLLRKEYRELRRQGDIYAIELLAKAHSVKVAFPFAKEGVERIAFSFPVEERAKDWERKKYILRRAAKLLGVPPEAVGRKKQALQYGAKTHKVVRKIWS